MKQYGKNQQKAGSSHCYLKYKQKSYSYKNDVCVLRIPDLQIKCQDLRVDTREQILQNNTNTNIMKQTKTLKIKIFENQMCHPPYGSFANVLHDNSTV